MRECKCQKCGYEWEPRKENPKSCPECKTRNWYKEPTAKDVQDLADKLRGAISEYRDSCSDSSSSAMLHSIKSLKEMGVSVDDIKSLIGEEDG